MQGTQAQEPDGLGHFTAASVPERAQQLKASDRELYDFLKASGFSKALQIARDAQWADSLEQQQEQEPLQEDSSYSYTDCMCTDYYTDYSYTDYTDHTCTSTDVDFPELSPSPDFE